MRIIFWLLVSSSLCTQSVLADLKVGFIGGFSGPGQAFGDSCRNGFEFARAEIPSSSLEVIYEDDQFVPARTIATFNKLVRINKVDLLIVLGSAPANAIAPLAERYKIPVIAWTGDPITAQGLSYVLRSWVSAVDDGMILAAELSKIGIKKAATVASVDPYSISILNGFTKKFPGEVISLGEVQQNVQDFRSLLTRAGSSSASALVMCLGVGQSASLAKQARDLGLKFKFFGCEILSRPQEINAAEGSLSGARYVTVPVAENFARRMQERFGEQATLGGAAVHYELYKLLATISGNPPKAEKLMYYLKNVHVDSKILGEFSAIEGEGKDWHFKLPTHIARVE